MQLETDYVLQSIFHEIIIKCLTKTLEENSLISLRKLRKLLLLDKSCDSCVVRFTCPKI